ncbi:histidine ammonia-lyase [Pseudoclavibacter endophyticus]|uniref:Aromatic amino acid lyase n=1 Tax=Pseudoclavibacter endophyticus TaxID=1778590 RepID=A0A6H9WFI8_9MICO|nr:aromatic amino acid ammonia-lyase [Pseudoclavibacter endophyticus]KAB1646898.1 aromatic amino acid lyase [Pseudoclavibacter endophyticus]GGA74598.1 histidine ammonia-lyase [Pseudoclavibacter endophyticus]
MTVTISGDGLTTDAIAAVSHGERVEITNDSAVRDRLECSRAVIRDALDRGEAIYGVSTLFGAMADHHVPEDRLVELQRLALWQHKTATGPRLPASDVRAAMLLRANSLLKGASAIRLSIIERYVTFLNADAVPHVFQRGSIGASGDLVPLSYIAGAVLGLDDAFLVDLGGETIGALTALDRLGLEPIELQPKEGLALNNGTGASTGVAANAVDRALDLAAVTIGLHALYAQALRATDQSFAPFVHAMKAHPGQIWAARAMLDLLEGSPVIRREDGGERDRPAGVLIQDRYSLRCLPQYLGPIIDGLLVAKRQIEIEANSANDNPLVDPDRAEILHTGNFLAQYTGVAMDQVRYHLGLLAKHVDVQIALLVSPEFNHGLTPSLTGNMDGMSVGLKSLQVATNQMMPLMGFYGQSIVDKFPTHAEQFNQNINSQAMNSANLARDTLDVFTHFLAVSSFVAVQSVELRAKEQGGTYDARSILSPATVPLYEAARRAAKGEPDDAAPLLWNDMDQFVQPMVEGLITGLDRGGPILQAVSGVAAGLRGHAPL